MMVAWQFTATRPSEDEDDDEYEDEAPSKKIPARTPN